MQVHVAHLCADRKDRQNCDEQAHSLSGVDIPAGNASRSAAGRERK